MTYLVFDVESVGLHGEGFAVGYVVINSETTKELESGFFRTQPGLAYGNQDGLEWVQANVVPNLNAGPIGVYSDGMGSQSPKLVRELFWNTWLRWKDNDALLAADCLWPVEARFLIDCIEDDPVRREWLGPYPFIDIASIRLAKGLDPLATNERLDRELPAHHPLADARQSARLLIEALVL